MDEVKLEQRLTTIEQGQKHMTDAIMAIQKVYEEFRDLAISVNTLAGEIKRVVDDVCGLRGILKEDILNIKKSIEKLAERIRKLEHKPVQRWESLIGSLINLLLGAIFGYIVKHFLG